MIIAEEWSLILGVEGAVHIAYKLDGIDAISPYIMDCEISNTGILATVGDSLGGEIEYLLAFKKMELYQRPPIYYHISQQGMLIDQDTSNMARVMYDLCSIIGNEAEEKGRANIDVEECIEGYREALQDYDFDIDNLMRVLVYGIRQNFIIMI